MDKLKIILADLGGYPLCRQKKVGENMIDCGLGNVLLNMEKHPAGVDFEIFLVISIQTINMEVIRRAKWIRKLLGKEPECYVPFELRSMPPYRRVDKNIYRDLQKKYGFITKLFFKNNRGFDIGAYNFGYQYLKKVKYEGDAVFMNTSVAGPDRDGWLLKYKNLFHQHKNTGLCGISMNSSNDARFDKPFMPHVQSFFLYTNMDVLTRVFKDTLAGAHIENNKRQIVNQGEVAISQRVLEAGYGISCSIFKDFFYTKDASWDIPQGDFRQQKKFGEVVNRL